MRHKFPSRSSKSFMSSYICTLAPSSIIRRGTSTIILQRFECSAARFFHRRTAAPSRFFRMHFAPRLAVTAPLTLEDTTKATRHETKNKDCIDRGYRDTSANNNKQEGTRPLHHLNGCSTERRNSHRRTPARPAAGRRADGASRPDRSGSTCSCRRTAAPAP